MGIFYAVLIKHEAFQHPYTNYSCSSSAFQHRLNMKRFPSVICELIHKKLMDLPGVEPGSPRCKRGIIPLDYRPNILLSPHQFLNVMLFSLPSEILYLHFLIQLLLSLNHNAFAMYLLLLLPHILP